MRVQSGKISRKGELQIGRAYAVTIKRRDEETWLDAVYEGPSYPGGGMTFTLTDSQGKGWVPVKLTGVPLSAVSKLKF